MQDELYGNKIAGAALAAALLFFAPPVMLNTVQALSHHGDDHHGEDHGDDNPLGLAYSPAEMVFAGGPAPKKVEIDLGTLLAAASAEKGARSAAVCKSCHTFEKGGANGTGPNLWGVVGRQAGGVEGFKFSKAINDFGAPWTYESLDGYLENSQKYLPGTAMVQKIRKEDKRADILAYLQTLSDAPVAFPAPAAPMEAAEMMEDGAKEMMEEAPAQ